MQLGLIWFASLALACFAGGIIAAQGPIYARFADGIGNPIQAGMLAFATGTLVFFVLALIQGNPFPALASIKQVPIWVWAGGAIGTAVVLISMFAVPKLGAATYTVAMIAGQLAASYVYDKFGVFGLTARDLSPVNMLGMALVLAGVVLTTIR
ncbi:MAG: DMT family transporter [Hyphomicrobiales bacterium]